MIKKLKERRGAINVTLTGYRFTGMARLNLWGGGKGDMIMDDTFLSIEEVKDGFDVNDVVNDGQFGCESIEYANIKIYEIYLVSRVRDNEIVDHNSACVFHSKMKIKSEEINERAKRGV